MSDTDEALRVRFEICHGLLQSEDGSKHGCNDWTARSAEDKHRSELGGGGVTGRQNKMLMCCSDPGVFVLLFI